MKLTKLLITTTLTITTQAHAYEFVSVQNLQQLLSHHNPQQQQTAIAYIAGAHDANNLLKFCTPPQQTLGELVDKTTNYLKDPKLQHFGAGTALQHIWHKLWPCKTI
jgi:hypothetical protein